MSDEGVATNSGQELPAKTPPRAANGWDGKLRINQDSDEDQEHSHAGDGEDSEELDPPPSAPQQNGAQVPPGFPSTEVAGAQIDADEDLLEDLTQDETEIHLNHCRVASLPSLRLERFPILERLFLRQNQISDIEFPEAWGEHLEELEFYDNGITHVRGLDNLKKLVWLDLSFNKIKHIRRIDHLTELNELFFVQNKISRIENLSTLTNLTNLELAANRIREIEGLDTLVNLRELWLGKNKITELKNLSSLSNLRLLSLQSNRITSASLGHLATLPNLTELYMSHNALEDVKQLEGCTGLQTLDVGANPLKSLAGLIQLTALEEIWASDCLLDSFDDLEIHLRNARSLHTAYFEGNPLQTRKRETYRNKLRLALPQLRQIDASKCPPPTGPLPALGFPPTPPSPNLLPLAPISEATLLPQGGEMEFGLGMPKQEGVTGLGIFF